MEKSAKCVSEDDCMISWLHHLSTNTLGGFLGSIVAGFL